jgi:hypothetical protein
MPNFHKRRSFDPEFERELTDSKIFLSPRFRPVSNPAERLLNSLNVSIRLSVLVKKYEKRRKDFHYIWY